MRAGVLTTIVGLLLAAGPGVYFARGKARGDLRALSPGPGSPGHVHMESACGRCHVGPKGDVQESCVGCHGADLAAEEDSHAASRFDDPSRAADLALIDANRCATCHLEHRPHLTNRESVSVPADFCVVCHDEVLTDRPSHAGLDVRGCAAAGCHRYHDNRALYLELLRARRDEPDLLAGGRLPARKPPAEPAPGEAALVTLTMVPADGTALEPATSEWRASAHARASVGCAACHEPPGSASWQWRPEAGPACARCHAPEQASFSMGKHGMRPAVGLPALEVAAAQLSMRPESRGRSLGCASCHGAHSASLREAAVAACERCHDDEHTRAFRRSAHFALWEREVAGRQPPGSGVSCAGCHLPRAEYPQAPGGVRVDHNQNRNLRPRDKMARPVCGRCHGLPFTLAALADDALVRRNFEGGRAPVATGFDLLKDTTSNKSQGGSR
jgi:hypothetical protein